MNDIQLFSTVEKQFNVTDVIKFITFDTNMEVIYVSTYKKLFGIDSKTLNVIIILLLLIFQIDTNFNGF